MHLLQHAADAVQRAQRGNTKLPPAMFQQPGMSSARVRILLNELCAFDACRYLEIGSWKGSTLLAASYRNPGTFLGVDNFTEFGGSPDDFVQHTHAWYRDCRFRLLQTDAWALDPAQVAPIDVYFYDGGHTEDEQYRAFTHFTDAFADTFIAVVDDWNELPVRHGTLRAFLDLRYRVLQDWDLFTDGNPDRGGWWNGVYVAVVSKPQ